MLRLICSGNLESLLLEMETRMVKYQKEVNEIRAKRIAKSANPLALVASAQPHPDNYYQAPKPQRAYAPAPKHTSTSHKGKEVAKPVKPPYELGSDEDSDPEQAQKDKEMQKNLALIAKYFKKLYKPTNNNLRTSSNSRNKTVDTSPRKPKRVKDYTYHKEKMLLCKQAEQGVPLRAEQEVLPADSDNTAEPLEKLQYNDKYNVDQNDAECIDERAGLANLIANLTLDTEQNKKILMQLKKANTSLTQELKECKSNIKESIATRDSCLIALQTKQTELEKYIAFNDLTVDYDKLQTKLNEALGLLAQKDIDIKEGLKLKAYEISVVKQKHDDLVKQSLLTKSHFEGLLKEKSKVISDLKVKEGKDIDKMISMEKQLKFLNEIVYKRNQSIQTIHMLAPKCSIYNGRPTFANPMYLKKAQAEKPCLYEIPYDNSDLANRFAPDWEETITLEKESRSKLDKDLVKPYDYTKQNKLVDQAWVKHTSDRFRAPTALDMEVLIKTCLMPLSLKTQNDSFQFVHELKKDMHEDFKYVESLEKAIDELESDKADFSNMYDLLLQECVSKDVMCSYLHSLSDLDAYNELKCLYLHKVKECEYLAEKLSKQTENVNEKLKKLIERCKGKSVETQFARPSVVRQPNAQRIPKPSVLGKPTPFSNSPAIRSFSKNELVNKTNVSDGSSKPVTAQILPQTASKATSRNTNPRMSTSTGVIHRTNVSRPTLMSNQMKEMVMPNNSQVTFKKMELEDHHRISSISKKTKSVTVCNDSLNSRTLNVNAVCADCGKCVFNSNHDACVSKYLKDVNAITKKPNVVPISSRKPKDKANKSVATPHKKTIFQLILFIVDSGCTKHMMGNLKLLCNFVEKFLGTVRFENDQFATILGYGDLIQGNVTIKRVYYVEGLNHNLFSVGQFYDVDLEVAFRKSTYTSSATSLCLMAKASPTQAWLWHRRLYHLNFDYINLLSKKDIVIGLPKLKYVKDQLCSSCEVSKAKRSSFKKKAVPSSKGRLNLLHMNLCTKFLNKTLHAYFKEECIEHQTSTPRTPEQNDVVERRNRTLVEAARTIHSASKLPLFFWAEAIATACYTQNRSIIISTHGKMTYHIINSRLPSIKHLHIFGCLCYLTRDGENLDKMKEKGDPCVMVEYSTQLKGYRVYNKRTRLVVESIHIKFDEIKEMTFEHGSPVPPRQEMSVDNNSSGLVLQEQQKASDYDNSDPMPPLQDVVPPTDKTNLSQQELEFLFNPLFEEYFSTENQTNDQQPSTQTTNVNAKDDNNDQAEDTLFQNDEFINPFCTPIREIAESFSCNIDNSNMHTFYQPYGSEYQWIKDHPLEQVCGNPSKPVQTRRQLATYPKMCMFALTVSTAEPQKIKEAMADSAWIEAMQEELH
ncbi:retrovirus-related pol polyprotein from transposon TNT 1-94 [Tanacetum coccineum]|uniref:Retrovirus-related pol polyprotein from transposon TNT 1-94 n=1 Tax=Tanacetum coccineum TaxID=301880 RepID=A0ABQ5B292_9ASTR